MMGHNDGVKLSDIDRLSQKKHDPNGHDRFSVEDVKIVRSNPEGMLEFLKTDKSG